MDDINEEILKECQLFEPLLLKIDDWEERSLNRIRTVAEDIRQQLRSYLEEIKTSLKTTLLGIKRPNQSSEESSEFKEIRTKQYREQLQLLKTQLQDTTPVEIMHDRDDQACLIRLITLKRRNDVSFSHISRYGSRWIQNAQTIIGGQRQGNDLNQLSIPYSIDIDEQRTIFVADYYNNRIVAWKRNAIAGEIIVGEKEPFDQLILPTKVLVDKKTKDLIISESKKRRIVRWSSQNQTHVQVLVSDVLSYGLALDETQALYVSDWERHEIRRYRVGESKGIIVAGGHGPGSCLNQLYHPWDVFVDRHQSIYITDRHNHRVMKWIKNAIQGIIVAGGHGLGSSLKQLSLPSAIFVQNDGSFYVADQSNHRIMRWEEGQMEGTIIVGGNGQGSDRNQLSNPLSFVFDREENLYVVDVDNHRIQQFNHCNGFSP